MKNTAKPTVESFFDVGHFIRPFREFCADLNDAGIDAQANGAQ